MQIVSNDIVSVFSTHFTHPCSHFSGPITSSSPQHLSSVNVRSSVTPTRCLSKPTSRVLSSLLPKTTNISDTDVANIQSPHRNATQTRHTPCSQLLTSRVSIAVRPRALSVPHVLSPFVDVSWQLQRLDVDLRPLIARRGCSYGVALIIPFLPRSHHPSDASQVCCLLRELFHLGNDSGTTCPDPDVRYVPSDLALCSHIHSAGRFPGHVVCQDCILQVMDVGNQKCPMGCNPNRKIKSWISLGLTFQPGQIAKDEAVAAAKYVSHRVYVGRRS